MFYFFKQKKPFLKDLVQEFTDIHSHVLFGIDDGAKTLEDSKVLLKSFIELGFEGAITTPHILKDVWDNNSQNITSKYTEVQQLLPELSAKINLRVASEYLMDESFARLFETEKLLTLKDNYVLVEMSYLNPPIQLYDIIFDLQVAGYKPVLAHPERYLFYHQNFEEYKKLKVAGCLFQMNLLSTMGYYGANITKVADKLLAEGLIDFAGSDVHHLHHIRAFDDKVKIKNTEALRDVIRNNNFFAD